jgi:hypothetical protein
MALLDIPLDRITEADVRRLIAAGAAESLYIDYKQATYGGKEADHRRGEFADLYQSSHMIATVGDPLLGTKLGESDESHAVSSEAERFCTVWGI